MEGNCRANGENIIVGHNVNFDINFLYDCLFGEMGCPLPNDFVDCLRIARKLLPKLPNHKLNTLAKYFKLDVQGMHRGLKDCIITNECFKLMKVMAIDEFTSIDGFIKNSTRKKREYDAKFKEVISQPRKIDQNHPLFGRLCVFTGELEKMTRQTAMQEVINLGGKCKDNLTKKTDYLIVGSFEYNLSIKGNKSSKLKKAEKYINELIFRPRGVCS